MRKRTLAVIGAGVIEKQLQEQQEIAADIDTLRWDYYQYIISHPIVRRDIPTAILYGGKDNLQPIEPIRSFSEKFGAGFTVSEQSDHSFMAPSDMDITEKWLYENI